MTRRRMAVVAGPSGSGKSRYFPVSAFGADSFNVDERAAAHNGGSSLAIPRAIRLRAQKECEAFIGEHIAQGKSFAVETTLRTGIAIEQARRATSAGFETALVFVTAGRADTCVERVRLRGLAGGHAAPEEEIREIYERSMSNMLLALDVFDRAELYDNSASFVAPRLIGRLRGGRFAPAVEVVPDWVPERLR